MSRLHLLALSVLFGVACGDDGSPADAGALDGGSDSGIDGSPDVSSPDASDAGCFQVAPLAWTLENADDVSISYEAALDGRIAGNTFGFLLLFERYVPGPDVGTFDLSEGPDSDFGTCAHCAYARSLINPELFFFAESGTLVTRSDPYGRVLDVTGTNIRLVQVTLDPETRASTPVPGGLCVEIAGFEVRQTYPEPGWTCDRSLYGDGMCHCDCGAADRDCYAEFPDPPPVPVDCTEDEICDFNIVSHTVLCNPTCDMNVAFGCGAEGVCIIDHSGQGIDRCATTLDVISAAGLDDPCMSRGGLQTYCNVTDGVAHGYCGYDDVCRRLCDGAADCEGTGFECLSFAVDGERGFCGPPPVDE